VSHVVIAPDDPRAPDVTALLVRHLELMRATTPAEFVFALDVTGLVDPAITFCSARRDGVVLGLGALKELDAAHGELKSMHTASEARGQGIGAALLGHLVGLARDRGYRRVSLETGSQAAFAPARALYAASGFAPCGPFGGYPDSANSVFMTLALAAG
jgi:putative acetyltransferase